MEIRYIDAHCHLQFDEYSEDRETVIKQMREEGVAGIVVGTDLGSSRVAVALAEKNEHLFASVGIHPHHASDDGLTMSIIHELAQEPKCVAIGECGLDYFRDTSRKNEQAALFRKHIELATEHNKPLIIHCRPSKGSQDAYQDLIAILKEAKEKFPGLRGDVHFFVGGIEEAHALIALDFSLSFTAVITFTHDYDEVIRSVPLSSILSETDAPYVSPAARRGKRNDPLAVRDVVARIAEIRGEDAEKVRNSLVSNAARVFGL
ncbi:TatD family hydrolase [Candidatus Kaiserbacteria bacterium]|nr:TatD family hydrolase [Candidatus Kaiserbacteria bacterium]